MTTQVAQAPHLLLVGGNSRLARAIVARQPEDGRVRSVVRRAVNTSHEQLQVDRYEALPPSAFDGISTVVNCAGIVGKREAPLFEAVNVQLPLALAKAAAAHGVPHMIHIGSFSVYGHATRVNAATAPAPVNDYGRSKLRADDALLALGDAGPAMSVLRFPILYGRDCNNKLARLLALMLRLGVFPVPATGPRRSMMFIDNAADMIWAIARRPRQGIVPLADPDPFTYALAATVIERQCGKRVRLPTLPRPLQAMMHRLAPGVSQNLFADSLLDDSWNQAPHYALKTTTAEGIASQLLSLRMQGQAR
jgi:nucleoside-diphosphate-sugar epimerase